MASKQFNAEYGLSVGNASATINVVDANANATLVALSANGNISFTGANVSLGSVSNLKISGGTANAILITDGAGNVSFASSTTGYVHTQSVAATTWTVTHNLGVRYVNVEVVDSTGNSYNGRYNYPTITFNNTTALTVTFDSAQSGYAAVTSGGGQQGPAGSSAANIANGTSNVNIPTSAGNVTTSVNGNANILVVTGTGVNVAGTLNATGNSNVGNLGASGNISATYFIGNGSQLTGISAGSGASISNGTSNVNIATSGGNVTVGVAGTANIMTIASSNVTIGTGSGGNITGANLVSSTYLQGFVQPSVGTITDAPITLTSGSLLASPTAGTMEFDGSAMYNTDNTTSGRGVMQPTQMYRYATAGSAIGPTISDYFPAVSSLNLQASSYYDIECVAYFLKTTLGTVVWTWTNSSAVTMIRSYYVGTVASGFTTSIVTGTPVTGMAVQQTSTALAHAATGSLSTAVYHHFHFKVHVVTNLATNIRLRVTNSAGTVTPQAGSYYIVRKLPVNAGAFTA